MLKGKITLVNLNIGNEEEVIKVNEDTDIIEIQSKLNLCIDAIINLLGEKDSIYEGFDLSIINDKISIDEVEKLISDYEKIFIVVEDENDIDYSVFFSFDKEE